VNRLVKSKYNTGLTLHSLNPESPDSFVEIPLWSPAGYDKGHPLNQNELTTVLTPVSVVNAVRIGYQPQMEIDLK